MSAKKRQSIESFAAGSKEPVEPIVEEDGNVREYESLLDDPPRSPDPAKFRSNVDEILVGGKPVPPPPAA